MSTPNAANGFVCRHRPHSFPADAWRRARARTADAATSSSQPLRRVASRTRSSGVSAGCEITVAVGFTREKGTEDAEVAQVATL